MDRRGALKLIVGAVALSFAESAIAQISAAENEEIRIHKEIEDRLLSGGLAFWYREMPESYDVETFPVVEKVVVVSDLSDISRQVGNFMSDIKEVPSGERGSSVFEMFLYGPKDGQVSRIKSYAASDLAELKRQVLIDVRRLEQGVKGHRRGVDPKELRPCTGCAVV